MAEQNLTITGDLARTQSIDFTNRFGENLTKLIEAMGVTRQLPLSEGMLIKTYTGSVDLKDGNVAEGAVIPLSKVTTEPGPSKEIELKKWRKAVSGEAIQRHGFDQAVTQTDEEMLRLIQRNIRKDLFDFMATGTGTASGVGLQSALAQAWGQIETLFEDDGADTIAFVNPLDVADYIGQANITTQTLFGMTFIEGFTNVTVITNSMVPKGKIYATASENIVVAYIPIPGSELARTFNLTSDESGYIGIVHGNMEERLSVQTIAVSGVTLFAERIDGVVVVDIEEEVIPTP